MSNPFQSPTTHSDLDAVGALRGARIPMVLFAVTLMGQVLLVLLLLGTATMPPGAACVQLACPLFPLVLVVQQLRSSRGLTTETVDHTITVSMDSLGSLLRMLVALMLMFDLVLVYGITIGGGSP